MKYYKIKESELLDLLQDSNQLNALRKAGVDNWEGWDERHNFMDEETVAEDLPIMYEKVSIYGCNQWGNRVLKMEA